MSRVDLIATPGNVVSVSDDLLSVVAVAVVFMLLSFALDAVMGLIAAFLEMMRPMLALIRAVIFIATAVAIVAAVLIVRMSGT